MPTQVALLRGINVSGQNLLRMESLRQSFEAMGFEAVRTYVQSGNILFSHGRSATEAALVRSIAARLQKDFGLTVQVMVRSASELGRIARSNPLLEEKGIDAAKLHVTFLGSAPAPRTEAGLKPLVAGLERCEVVGREVFLYCPDGYGRSRLSNAAIEKKLGVTATTRSWKTVQALLELLGAEDPGSLTDTRAGQPKRGRR